MKLGFFTDVHARLDNPSSRSDWFPKTIIEKLERVGEIFKNEGVQFALNGGDTTHIPSPSLSLVNRLTRVFKDWQIPIIAITGSHDVHGYQQLTLERTAVGELVAAGLFHMVGCTNYPKYIDLDNKVRVYGTGYMHAFDAREFSVLDPEHNSKLIIQMIHADLLDKPVPWQYVLVNQVYTNAQLVLSGHYHPGWKEGIVSGTSTFFNPGSIGRIERGPYRIPRVMIIDTKPSRPGVLYDYKFVDVPCDPHPFTEKPLDKVEEMTMDINQFVSLLDLAQVEIVDVKGKIPILGRELELSEEVIDRTIQLLERPEKKEK